jgi:large subunit ribosomal protein L9
MKVILLQDVAGIGKAGQVVKISDGHARNLLIPRGMVKEATDSNIRELERQKAASALKRANDLESAQTLAKQIATLQVKIVTKGGEGGRLFGSITAKDIAEALMQQHKLEIDKRKFILDSPIKQVGEHLVDIKLYTDVTAKLRVIVEV